MADQANVSSIDAIDRFRSSLIVYLEKARTTVDDVSDEVQKTRRWLEGEQTRKWQVEIRKRARRLEEAQQELFTARLSSFTEDTQFQQMAVNRAKRELEAAEEKLKKIRRWIRDFDSIVMPVARQLEKLDSVLTAAMPKAVAQLDRIVQSLENYAGVSAPVSPTSAPPSDPAPPSEIEAEPTPPLPSDPTPQDQ